jgi:hypothetical protein
LPEIQDRFFRHTVKIYLTYTQDIKIRFSRHHEQIFQTSGTDLPVTDLTDILDRFTSNIEKIYQTHRTDVADMQDRFQMYRNRTALLALLQMKGR